MSDEDRLPASEFTDAEIKDMVAMFADLADAPLAGRIVVDSKLKRSCARAKDLTSWYVNLEKDLCFYQSCTADLLFALDQYRPEFREMTVVQVCEQLRAEMADRQNRTWGIAE